MGRSLYISAGLPDFHSILTLALFTSLQTSLPALYPPSTLAASMIHLSTLQHRLPLPSDWWRLFDVEHEDLVCVAGRILSLYERIESGEGRRAWRLEGRSAVRDWLETAGGGDDEKGWGTGTGRKAAEVDMRMR